MIVSTPYFVESILFSFFKKDLFRW